MANQYFNEELHESEFQNGSVLSFFNEEARHAFKVSRVREGEFLRIGNGKGFVGLGAVTSASEKCVSIQAEQILYEDKPHPTVTLVQALAKAGRDERAVEQATEYGVDFVIPWQAERSVVRWNGEKSKKGIFKWQKICREASKQSLRGHIPECLEVQNSTGIAKLAGDKSNLVLILEPDSELKFTEYLRQKITDGDFSEVQKVILIVGPEGGISPVEKQLFEEAGAVSLKLGETVLRTSSAGSAALAIVNAALGRW